jgi:hypothetical protein
VVEDEEEGGAAAAAEEPPLVDAVLLGEGTPRGERGAQVDAVVEEVLLDGSKARLARHGGPPHDLVDVGGAVASVVRVALEDELPVTDPVEYVVGPRAGQVLDLARRRPAGTGQNNGIVKRAVKSPTGRVSRIWSRKRPRTRTPETEPAAPLLTASTPTISRM